MLCYQVGVLVESWCALCVTMIHGPSTCRKVKRCATWVIVDFWTPITNSGKIRSVLMAMKNLELLRFHY